LGFIIFGAAAICAVVWLMVLGRDLTFFFDEWNFVNDAATTGYWHNVLQPHNGHPSMIPFTVYELLLKTVGLRRYWPYRLAVVLLDVGCGWLIFVLLRRKVHPVAAGAGAAALMLLGAAWQDLLWPFQIGFLGSVAGGLGALTLLDRDSRRAHIGACACLVASIACSAVGLPFLAGVALELAWRRRSWHLLWVPALPLALFIAWYETIGKSPASGLSPLSALHSIDTATATTVGALVGRGTTVGAVLSALIGVLIIVALVRSPGRAGRLAMAVSGLMAFWILTLLARGVPQSSPSRYLYPAAAFVLVAVGELPALITRSSRGRIPRATSGWARIAVTTVVTGLVAYTGAAIWWNANTLTRGSTALTAVSSQVRAELGAVELAGPALPGDFQPDRILMPQVSVGPYLRAVSEFGSLDGSTQAVLRPDNQLGAALDGMVLRGRPIDISAIVPGFPLLAHIDDTCTSTVVSPGDPARFRLPRGGALVTAPEGVNLTVRVRGLAAAFPDQPLAIIGAGSTRLLRWSPRRTALHWTVELTPSLSFTPARSVTSVCRLSLPERGTPAS
jgi:hypothetical protein